MNNECMRVENEIWDSVAAGTQVSENVLQHARNCPDCARALAEAQNARKMLLCAAPYPESPDCRQAVMDRISRGRRTVWTRRLAWAAAPALLAVGLVAIMMPVKQPRVPATSPRAAMTKPAKPKPAPVVQHEAPKPAEVAAEVAVDISPPAPKPQPVAVKRIRPPKREIGRIDKMALNQTRPTINDHGSTLSHLSHTSHMETSSAADVKSDESPADTVMASVSVQWSATPKTEDMSYQFTEEDSATGTVTTASVERKGSSIRIEMESTPVENPAPVKGEVTHEKKSTA